MRSVLFKAVPYSKEQVTLALESGVDGIIAPEKHVGEVRALARSAVFAHEHTSYISLKTKEDEHQAAALAKQGGLVVLTRGWQIIPVENLLAQDVIFGVEVSSLQEAQLASEVMEQGAPVLVTVPEALGQIKEIIQASKYAQPRLILETAVITAVTPAGMGHRVCVDTSSLLKAGQGMLVGNSAAFTFLVNAETEANEYVAARPFRINAGSVHSYTLLPGDRTAYLEELQAGGQALIVHFDGQAQLATVGRTKTERRPLLLIEAKSECSGAQGAVLLQNAETICLVTPEGSPISVVALAPGSRVLCRADAAGRHFGMRITETILEN